MENTEKIFYKDPTVLYKKFYEIVPKTNYPRSTQSNIIVRISLYLIIILFAIGFTKAAFVPVSVIALATIFYIVHDTDKDGKKKDIERILDNRKKKIEKNIEKYDDFKKFPNYFLDKDNLQYDSHEDDIYTNNSFEAGYLDSEGNSVHGTYYGADHNNHDIVRDNLFTLAETEQYEKSRCKKPTYDNPFMNHNSTDYNRNKDNIPKACNVDDDEINEDMDMQYHKNMFRNIDDVFDLENSKRQFYTLPAQQVPNNQKEFAMWLYGTGPTCKEDSSKCLRYEDLRHKRRIL